MQLFSHRHRYSLLSLLRSHDDLPALKAAYWVFVLLAAMLFNLGVFVLLIATHVALDVWKYRFVHGERWRTAFEGVVRENVVNTALLSCGVLFAIYFHVSLPIVSHLRGFVQTEVIVLSAILQMTVKAHIAHNMLTIISRAHQYIEREHPRMGHGLSLQECVWIAVFIASLGLTLSVPWILHVDAARMASLVSDVFVPWHL